jgi:hypothetical protein
LTALEVALGAVALFGAVFVADGLHRLGLVLLAALMLYDIVREIRSPGQLEARAAAHDEPPGPWLVGSLIFVLLFATSFGVLGDRVDGWQRIVVYVVTFTISWGAGQLVRTRLQRLPRFRQRADQP